MANNSDFTLGVSKTSPVTTDSFRNGVIPAVGSTTADNVLRAAFAQWMSAQDADQELLVRTLRDYYDGEHEYMLTDRMKQFLQLATSIKFDLNYLPIPVDTLVERLSLKGFEIKGRPNFNNPGSAGPPDTFQSAVMSYWWQQNRMDAVQQDVHHAAARDGDSYVIVGWANGRGIPTFSMETAYDGTNGVVVRYEESDAKRIRFAVKRWRIESGPAAGTVMRMNVFTPSAIFKYVTGRFGWVPFQEPGDESWPIDWTDLFGIPIGIPVIHFKNKAAGYSFGKSEIEDLIPPQDALNKAVLDELAAADTEAFRMITLSGGKKPEDLTIGPGRVLWAPAGNWDSIPAGNLAGVVSIVEGYIRRMAQLSRTPLSYFQITGQVASAETQRADDTGLVAKAEDRALYHGNSWEDVMATARRLNNVFGEQPLDDTATIEAVWNSFERVDKGQLDRLTAETSEIKAQTYATLRGQGVPADIAAREAGYDEETAELMAARADRIRPEDRL